MFIVCQFDFILRLGYISEAKFPGELAIIIFFYMSHVLNILQSHFFPCNKLAEAYSFQRTLVSTIITWHFDNLTYGQ